MSKVSGVNFDLELCCPGRASPDRYYTCAGLVATQDDAAAYATFLEGLAVALHKYDLILTVDISSSCWMNFTLFKESAPSVDGWLTMDSLGCEYDVR